MSSIKTVLLLTFLSLAAISAALVSPALPQIMQAFDVNQAGITWLTGLFLLGYMLGQLLYAPLANRYGSLNALRGGLVLMVMGVALCCVACQTLSYPELLLGRFLAALGAASGLSCTFILLRQTLPAEKAARAAAFGPLFFTIGIGGSAFVGGWLTSHYRWQLCFYTLFIHALLMLALSFCFRQPKQDYKKQSLGQIASDYAQLAKSGRFCFYAFCVGMISIIAYCYSAAAPLYAHNSLHLSAEQYGRWNCLNMLGMAGSSFFAVFILKHKSAGSLFPIALIGMLPGLLSLAYIASHPHGSIALFFLTTSWLYLFGGLLFPAGSTFAMQQANDPASGASMMSFINIGSAFICVSVLGYLPLSIITAYTMMLVSGFLIIALGYRWILKTQPSV